MNLTYNFLFDLWNLIIQIYSAYSINLILLISIQFLGFNLILKSFAKRQLVLNWFTMWNFFIMGPSTLSNLHNWIFFNFLAIWLVTPRPKPRLRALTRSLHPLLIFFFFTHLLPFHPVAPHRVGLLSAPQTFRIWPVTPRPRPGLGPLPEASNGPPSPGDPSLASVVGRDPIRLSSSPPRRAACINELLISLPRPTDWRAGTGQSPGRRNPGVGVRLGWGGPTNPPDR